MNIRSPWVLAMLVLGAPAPPCLAETSAPGVVAQPEVVPGDEWVYRITTDRRGKFSEESADSVVKRVTATTLLLSTTQPGSDSPPRESLVGRDWDRFRNVNGADVVVNRPLDFPLSVGKHWDSAYSEDNPNAAHSREIWRVTYTVVGWETVDTPAGKFQTLKVEGEGDWKAITRPGAVAMSAAQPGAVMSGARTSAARTVVGRLYRVLYYAPAVKRWVKSDEEIYDTNSVRSERIEAVLQSFKPGAAPSGM
ncbi:MAG TPA: hypothetical protein VFC47_13495 [Caulobacteraceae bacterium]|nr:hypothetical protein [Caulobacteraceae bacterium]